MKGAPLLKFLIASWAALIVFIAIVLATGFRADDVTASGNALTSEDLRVADTRLEFAPIAEYMEFVERPLFNSTRRPIEPVVEETGTGSTDLDKVSSTKDFELSGIWIDGARRLAIIKDKRDNKYHHVREGDPFLDWNLDQVQTEKIQVSKGRSKLELPLVRQGDKQLLRKKKARSRTTPTSNRRLPSQERTRNKSAIDAQRDASKHESTPTAGNRRLPQARTRNKAP